MILLCLDLRGGFLFTLDPCVFLRSLVLECRIALPHGAQPSIPDGEEGLGEICLDAPTLMVDIMVRGVVARDMLQWIPWKRVSAVIVDSLGGAKHKEEKRHARRHHADLVGQTCTSGVQYKAFYRVIVESAVCVGHIEAVVTSVPMSWKEHRC